MRKWIAVFGVIILIPALFYMIFPSRIDIHQKLDVSANTRAFTRQILDEKKWQLWWPDDRTKYNRLPVQFEYKGNVYTLTEKKMTSISIDISKGKESLMSELFFIPIGNDSIQLNWIGSKETNYNPLNRIQSFSWAKSVDSDLHFLLEKMQSFYSNEDNIYGIHIRKSLVADSNYMFTSIRTTTYPSTEIVYNSIERLKQYIQMNKGQITGYPMLNVYKDSDNSFHTKLALPVDKQLKNSGNIQYRWMLKGGNILVAEVNGGPHQIERAFDEMQNYLQDHQRIAPAIPFQSLITDRRQEPDTNKWVTKLYWPVM